MSVARRAVIVAVLAILGLLTAACGSGGKGDGLSANAPPTPDTGSSNAATASATEGPSSTGFSASLDTTAFNGGNDEASISAAVAAFPKAGVEFLPPNMAANLASSCVDINVDAVGEIIGAGVTAEDVDEALLKAQPGYLSCSLRSTENPDVILAAVHLAPDLKGQETSSNGFGDNWAFVGTMNGAVPIEGLGDRAVWSDGSGGNNLTNKLMLQLLVDGGGGGQVLFQAWNSERPVAIRGEWRLPTVILAMSQIAHDLTE